MHSYSKLHRPQAFALALSLIALVALATACGGKSPQDLMLSAQEMASAGDLYGAEMQLQRVIRDHPDAPEALEARQGLVFIYMMTQNFDGAEEQLDVLVEASGGPQTEAGMMHLSDKIYILVQQGKTDEAMQLIDATSSTLANAPVERRLQLSSMRASVLNGTNQNEAARAEALQLLEAASATPEFHAQALDIVNRVFAVPADNDQPSSAALEQLVQVHRDFIARFPDSPAVVQSYFSIAQSLEILGRGEEAESAYDQARALIERQVKEGLGSERVEALARLAGYYVQRNQLDKTAEVLERIVAEFPDSQHASAAELTLAQIERQLGNYTGAQERLQRFIAANPQSPAAQEAIEFLQLLRAEASSTTTQAQQLAPPAGAVAIDDTPATATEAVQPADVTEPAEQPATAADEAPAAEPEP